MKYSNCCLVRATTTVGENMDNQLDFQCTRILAVPFLSDRLYGKPMLWLERAISSQTWQTLAKFGCIGTDFAPKYFFVLQYFSDV